MCLIPKRPREGGGYKKPLRSLADPPQDLSHDLPLPVFFHGDRAVIAIFRFQKMNPVGRDEPRQGKAALPVPGNDNFSVQLFGIGLRTVHGHDVSVVNERAHGGSLHAKAIGLYRVWAQERRRRDHFFRLRAVKIGKLTAFLPDRSGLYIEQWDRDHLEFGSALGSIPFPPDS